MELDDSLEFDVQEAPQDEKVKGSVVEITVGTRAEIFNMEEGESPRYGDRDDRMVQVEVESTYDGESYTTFDTFSFPETVTSNHDLGKYTEKYGNPEEGQSVVVRFDEDGQSSIVLEEEE